MKPVERRVAYINTKCESRGTAVCKYHIWTMTIPYRSKETPEDIKALPAARACPSAFNDAPSVYQAVIRMETCLLTDTLRRGRVEPKASAWQRNDK